jgi:hypothetical protein
VTADASNLVAQLAVLLSRRIGRDQMRDHLEALQKQKARAEPCRSFNTSHKDERFAQHVAFERLIPTEQSGSPRESLATLLMRSDGSNNFAEFDTYGDEGIPVLLLSVPVGIILCGDGRDLGYALGDAGLRDQLFAWLQGERPD